MRYRAKLVALRSGLKTQVHAVMAKQGILPELDDMFGPGGQKLWMRCRWIIPARCGSSRYAISSRSTTAKSSCSRLGSPVGAAGFFSS